MLVRAQGVDGNWHHFAVRYTAATLRNELFFDGPKVDERVGRPAAVWNVLLLATNGDNGLIRMFGDELALYRRRFTDAEIGAAAGR